MAIFPIIISVRLQRSIAVLQFMIAHKRLSLFEALQALQDDDFGDENTGGISTDEEDDLDRLLGLTDGVSRQVFYVFTRLFVACMCLHLMASVCDKLI